jgi:creatinine amidohydrolase
MAELTATEARELLALKPVILLPMGSHEDQGPHAPMGDYLSAERMAEIIARRATAQGVRCFVAPVVPFGGADYFGTMPGGIALSQPTLCAVIRDMLSCLLRHGLDRLVVINGHAGNVAAIHQMTQDVYRERGILIPSFYLWQVAYRVLPSLIGAEKAARVAGHGADPLTSVAWHLFPDLMRPDLVPPPAAVPRVLDLEISGFGTFSFQGVDIQVPVELNEIAPGGVFRADARLSSPETGKLLVERLSAIGADFVAHYAAHADKRK